MQKILSFLFQTSGLVLGSFLLDLLMRSWFGIFSILFIFAFCSLGCMNPAFLILSSLRNIWFSWIHFHWNCSLFLVGIFLHALLYSDFLLDVYVAWKYRVSHWIKPLTNLYDVCIEYAAHICWSKMSDFLFGLVTWSCNLRKRNIGEY